MLERRAVDELHGEELSRPRARRGHRSRRCSGGSAPQGACASRSKRASRSGSSANPLGSVLIATSRPSLRILRAVHLAHTAGAEVPHHLIDPEAIAGCQGHRRLNLHRTEHSSTSRVAVGGFYSRHRSVVPAAPARRDDGGAVGIIAGLPGVIGIGVIVFAIFPLFQLQIPGRYDATLAEPYWARLERVTHSATVEEMHFSRLRIRTPCWTGRHIAPIQ